MASQSAHFNLTKPATTDNYNIAVFNTNTDLIDTQMYNNQQSAAKEMVGATASSDGESGRVPAPTSSDKDKYLKGDGTWDTPSGGGGGSTVSITPTLATGIKIAEYEIDGVGGDIYAPNGGGGSSTLAELSDVSVSNLINGQLLKYNSSTQKWENVNDPSSPQTASGTFTTGANQYDKVEINCGFRPDYIQVLLPFSQSDTVATYDSEVSTTTSTWYIPQESRTYTLTLGESQGETGISDITDTGFKFRCNAGNTRNVACTYIARKAASCGSSEVEYSTIEHKIGTWIDGSDVYEKTIVLRENGTNNYTYSSSVFSQCLPANINWIDIVSFYSKRNTGGYVDCMNNSSETNIVPNPSNQSIYYQTSHNASDVIVTIRYTKTGGNS